MLKKCAVMAALVLALSPAAAHADWLFTPNLGTTFGGAASGNEHFTYGASIGWMGNGIFGWEADLSYTPSFFEPSGGLAFVDSSNVVSVMGNAIIGIPIGGQHGQGFRPYAAAGLGLLRREVQSANTLFNVDTHDWGYNLGAGAMGFVSEHIGFRGDIRYIRSFKDLADNFDVGSFNYWRGTGGVTFRW